MNSQERRSPLKILGVDPGTFSCGYAVVQLHKHTLSYISSGSIVMPKASKLHKRLEELYNSLSEVIMEFDPEVVVVERIFYAKSAKSALTLGHCRGVVLLCASLFGKPIFEYTALEVKKAVTGYGKADKMQVKKTILQLLQIPFDISYDSADALAVACCHANTIRFV